MNTLIWISLVSTALIFFILINIDRRSALRNSQDAQRKLDELEREIKPEDYGKVFNQPMGEWNIESTTSVDKMFKNKVSKF